MFWLQKLWTSLFFDYLNNLSFKTMLKKLCYECFVVIVTLNWYIEYFLGILKTWWMVLFPFIFLVNYYKCEVREHHFIILKKKYLRIFSHLWIWFICQFKITRNLMKLRQFNVNCCGPYFVILMLCKLEKPFPRDNIS